MGSKLIHFISCLILLSSCASGPYYSKSARNWTKDTVPDSAHINYSIYLIGDAGGPNLQHQEPTLKLLQSQIEKDSNSCLLFLGDNIYHNGLPAEGKAERHDAEKKITEQMKIVNNYKGEIYFISGNHDWDYMKEDGLAQVKREEEYIENYLNRGNTFIPDGGCPGPYYVKIYSSVILIAIDSQWWLHKYEKPYGRCGDCDAENEEDFLIQFEDFIKNNRNKHIMIVAHHPLVSNGNHGGYYNILDHIFPLRLIRPHWYVPLPVIGSLYPLHRKFGGVDQDIPHYRYQEFKNNIYNIIEKYDNVIYASGHDHNLQFHKLDSISHIISGSGSRVNPVKGGGKAEYTHKHNGFAVVHYYDNGEAWVEFWIPHAKGDTGSIAFRTKLYTRKVGMPESYCSLTEINYKDSSVFVIATKKFQIGKQSRYWYGEHYRKEWGTPVRVPLLDLKTEKGGLIPYGIGGGKQSVTLKLKNLDEKEYVLRAINKDPSKRIPNSVKETFIEDVVRDQISAEHPYGALIVPKLADAVGVLHTNPQVVLIPDDSCLGPYKEQFRNKLVMFEEDPDGNHDDVASLGFSEKIVGTDRMRERIETDTDNKLDERNFTRARLLDMLIGDWDRLERQFRWATIKTNKGNLYKPIPVDRDQAFFKFDGAFPYLVSRRWGMRYFQSFENDYKDVIGLNFGAKSMDRRFLSSISRNDWKSIADSMKSELTDSIIENAVHNLPPEVFNIHGPEIISKLKSRRDQLPKVAEKYYLVLARYVNIFGTDKRERFVVERIDNKQTRVSVYKVNSEDQVRSKIYDRTFYIKETKEIRLYGLGNDDQVVVSGKVKRGIKIRTIAGEGEDIYVDSSKVAGIKKKSTLYDNSKEKSNISAGHETKKELSKKETIHYPSQDQFFYRSNSPHVTFHYNPDDGAFIGVGLSSKKYKFRQNPYGTQHLFIFNKATTTGSNFFYYRGDFRGVFGTWDLALDLDLYTPFAMNFFGYGNESVKQDTTINFYREKLDKFIFNPLLKKSFTKFLVAGFGPKYQFYNLQRNSNSYLGTITAENSDLYTAHHYLGLRGFFKLGTRDNDRNPTRGILLTGEANYSRRLDRDGFYSQYLSEFSFYITPNIPFQLTFAGRIGGAVNSGEFEFYQANFLGTATGMGLSGGNLRGFRKTRFIGDKSFYQNAEVRAQVARFNTFIFPGKFGLIAFVDNGKVWAANQNTKGWHTGYGGGVWFDLFLRFIVSATYGFSNEGQVANVRLGFFF